MMDLAMGEKQLTTSQESEGKKKLKKKGWKKRPTLERARV